MKRQILSRVCYKFQMPEGQQISESIISDDVDKLEI